MILQTKLCDSVIFSLWPYWLLCFSSSSLSSFILPPDLDIVILSFSKGCPSKFQVRTPPQRGHSEDSPSSLGSFLFVTPTSLIVITTYWFIFLLACLKIYSFLPLKHEMYGGGFYLFILCFSPVSSTYWLFSGLLNCRMIYAIFVLNKIMQLVISKLD